MRPITPIPCMLRSGLRTDFMAGVVINRSRGNKIKIIAKGNNRGRKRRVNMNIVGPLSMCLVIKVLKQKRKPMDQKDQTAALIQQARQTLAALGRNIENRDKY